MSRSRRSAAAAASPRTTTMLLMLLALLVVLCVVAITTTTASIGVNASMLVSPRRAHVQHHRPLRPTPSPTTAVVRVPSTPVYPELTAALQQQQDDETATLTQPKYYINIYDNATSCAGKMTTYDLTPFAGNLSKCVEGASGLDSAVLSPCAINPGGDSDFAYAFFSQPMCKGAVNTTLYAAGTPTDNDGCFLVLVQTPTARGTVAIQAQCPPA